MLYDSLIPVVDREIGIPSEGSRNGSDREGGVGVLHPSETKLSVAARVRLPILELLLDGIFGKSSRDDPPGDAESAIEVEFERRLEWNKLVTGNDDLLDRLLGTSELPSWQVESSPMNGVLF